MSVIHNVSTHIVIAFVDLDYWIWWRFALTEFMSSQCLWYINLTWSNFLYHFLTRSSLVIPDFWSYMIHMCSMWLILFYHTLMYTDLEVTWFKFPWQIFLQRINAKPSRFCPEDLCMVVCMLVCNVCICSCLFSLWSHQRTIFKKRLPQRW